MSEQESLGQELYGGAAGVGRIAAVIGAVVATIVGLVFIAGGIFNLTKSSNLAGGWVLILIGVLLIAISWIWVYLTRKLKFLAAVGGADTIIRSF